MIKSTRRRYASAFMRAMEREAHARARNLRREADHLGIADTTFHIEVHGELRATAYMNAGWHPASQTYEKQQWGSFEVQVPIYMLTMER